VPLTVDEGETVADGDRDVDLVCVEDTVADGDRDPDLVRESVTVPVGD
jgi:hypothetical protein